MGASALRLRVMMPDGSDCMFNEQLKRDRLAGGYLCLQGGGLVERGIWRVSRSY